MSTMKELAEYVGVSVSTVSRVLNGSTRISKDTRQRVLEAARLLNFSPNPMAKSLRLGTTNTIALMIPSIQNLMFPSIVRGVEDAARRHGYMVVLCNTDEDVTTERDYIERLKNRWVDGFIVCSMLPTSSHILQLRQDDFPCVLISRRYGDEVDAITVDNETAGYDATRYLIDSGHKRIALVLGREELNVYRDRYIGYQQALADAGIPYDDELVLRETLEGTQSIDSQIEQMVQALGLPDAIFASSDPKAIIVLRSLARLGIKVPEEVSVLGFDNIELASQLSPPLSTVAQPLYHMGELAAKRLITQIAYKKEHGVLPPPIFDLMPTELLIRKSTGFRR